MTQYQAPINDISFLIHDVIGLKRTSALHGRDDMSEDLTSMLFEEAAKFAQEILAPLNQIGDRNGCTWVNGEVKTAPGFKDAYQTYIESGWNGIRCEEEFGGQDLPHLVAVAIEEMMSSANLSFALSPALNMGAIEALTFDASAEVKETFLHKMVSGEWSGTMNLTESQAGSDLGNIRCKAIPHVDHYLISGQKIFITYGDHDFTDNIIHLVLARTVDAPAGVKGISLFVVPKFNLNADGSLGDHNDVHCVSIENKLGIHASPTCVLSFGDQGGAKAYLVGKKNHGLEYMFIMMNLSRLNTGLQGTSLSERSYQHALAYAKNRIQGGKNVAGVKQAIIEFPDVKRMLLSMKSQNEAMRALVYAAAEMLDGTLGHSVVTDKALLAELLTPIVKGWCTEVAQEVTYLGIQIHGGMGFIEETGIAQYYRDARITTIYEGTTAIQANDLVMRKIARDQGEAYSQLLALMQGTADQIAHYSALSVIATAYQQGINQLKYVFEHLMTLNTSEKLSVAVPFLMLTGYTAGAWMMARSSIAAQKNLDLGLRSTEFSKTKIKTVQFYMLNILPKGEALAQIIENTSDLVYEFSADAL